MKTADVPGELRENARQIVSTCLDTSVKMGQAMLELYTKSTTWAKETPLDPLFEAQRDLGRQMLDTSVELVRRLWGVIEQGEQQVNSAAAEQGKRIITNLEEGGQQVTSAAAEQGKRIITNLEGR
jgi:hypothetical protein